MQLWRVVEHQAAISTRALTDTLAEQERLEQLLEATKPPKPPETPPELHYLLHTPFRYYPCDGLARFSSPRSHGHFYGAEAIPTALAEYSFRQWCILDDMACDHAGYVNELPRTVFAAAAMGFRAIDLTQPPFAAFADQLCAPQDYTACQELADAMQAEDIHAARYRSVRDPEAGTCGVLFTAAAFAQSEPLAYQTWNMRLDLEAVEWVRLAPAGVSLVFAREAFLVDGRLPRPSAS
ncbi:MAG: RES family NAD+ phosphorylase [Planctomycetota bacterium]